MILDNRCVSLHPKAIQEHHVVPFGDIKVIRLPPSLGLAYEISLTYVDDAIAFFGSSPIRRARIKG